MPKNDYVPITDIFQFLIELFGKKNEMAIFS